MRILFVAPYPPSPVRTRLYGFITHLAPYHKIDVLSLAQKDQSWIDIRELQKMGINITIIQNSRLNACWRTIAALPSTRPLQVAFAGVPLLHQAVQERLATGNYDLLHIESIRVLGAIPYQLPVPAIWDAVDALSTLYSDAHKANATWLMRLLGSFEAQRLLTYEQLQIQRFRSILVAAERDRQYLTQLSARTSSPAKIFALPHGIDRAYFRSYSGQRQNETLIFSGRMSFHANIASVRWLVKEIMPLLWRNHPDLRLVIAGSHPPASIQRLAHDRRIVVTGYLPDLRLAISQASISLCPLLYAAGVQNKILEAMALGTPVVATSCAAAGLQAVAGRDLLVADNATDFAHAVLRLLSDQPLWQQLTQNALAYIATYYTWERAISQLTMIYEQTLTAWKENAYA